MYCGAVLPVTAIQSAPAQRNIDAADLAFNAVLLPSAHSMENAGPALAAALKIELDEAESFIRANKPLPVARCQARPEAELIAVLIRSLGFGAKVVADEELLLKTELFRARKIAIADGRLSVNHSGGVLTLNADDIRLLVLGSLRKTRIDYSENIVGGKTKAGGVLDSHEFLSDETLLDVYTASLETSFRIKADAFDYSGLATPLSYRIDLNLKSSIAALTGAAPAAVVDSDFSRLRALLSRAWPERSRNESRGIRRTGLSFKPISQQSILSDNSDQFERYSRLMFLL
jgi:hypothetical protein